MRRFAWILIILGSACLTCGNLVLGALVAPVIFATLNREEAGLAFGNILSVWSAYVAWPLVLLVVLGLVILLAIRLFRGHFNWVVLVVVLGVGLLALHAWSNSLVQQGVAVRERIRSLDAAPRHQQEDTRLASLRRNFDYLHRTSTKAFLAETILGLVLVISAGSALVFTNPQRQRREQDKPEDPSDHETRS